MGTLSIALGYAIPHIGTKQTNRPTGHYRKAKIMSITTKTVQSAKHVVVMNGVEIPVKSTEIDSFRAVGVQVISREAITESVCKSDISGDPAKRSRLTFGESAWTLDVTQDELEDLLEDFVALATHSERGQKTDSDGSEKRNWALANGFSVAERGKFSAEVNAAYAAAHPGA